MQEDERRRVRKNSVVDKDEGRGGMEGQVDAPEGVRSQAVESTQSEPSTVTQKLDGSVRSPGDSLEATPADITRNQLPGASGALEQHRNSYSLQEGAAAQYDPDEESVGQVDDVGPSDVQGSAKEHGMDTGVEVKADDLKQTEDDGDVMGALRTTSAPNALDPESDSDLSPIRPTTSSMQTALMDKSDALERRIENLEEVSKNIVNKLDVIINNLGNKGETSITKDMFNVVHSLLYHLENNATSNTFIENKLLPLKTILADGLHRKCVAKYIIDRLVSVLEEHGSLTPKCLNALAGFMRVVMCSKPVGGKKDQSFEDEEDLNAKLVEMKSKMTFLIIRTIQDNPRIGVEGVSVNGNTKRVGKPKWLEHGFTTTKHIMDFYLKNTRTKKDPDQICEKDVLCEAIIRKINNFHGKELAKIRERVRMDSMKEVLFLFDEMKVRIVSERDHSVGPTDVTKVPILATSRVPLKQRKKMTSKLWERTNAVVGDQYKFKFSYDVHVDMEDPDDRGSDGQKRHVRKKMTMVREVDFLACGVLILMRLTGIGNFQDLLMFHDKVTRVIVAIAEILVSLIECEYHGAKDVDKKKEGCPVDEEEYHILALLATIRPTQASTRRDIIINNIINLTEEEFDKLNTPEDGVENNDGDGDNGEDTNGPEHPFMVDDEDESDEMFREEELGSAINFLANM